MSKRERWTEETAPRHSSEDARESRVSAWFTAAYRDLEPSDRLQRRVAELVARRDSERSGQRAWWPPIAWASVAGVGVLSLMGFLGLTHSPLQAGGPVRKPAPVTANGLLSSQTSLAPRSIPPSGTNDPARRIATREGARPRRLDDHDSLAWLSAHPSARRMAGDRLPPGPPTPHRHSVVISPQGSEAGDLAYLNREPALVIPRWTPRSNGPTMEARILMAVRPKDDFITIPFPRLATSSAQQIAQAAESYKREAAIVDPRLAHEVTCASKATALSDLCSRLRTETGIQLTAGPSVADEKVTLFCEKLPLREVMRQLSRPFGYTWLRSKAVLGSPVARGPGSSVFGNGPADPNTEHPGPRAAGDPNTEYRYELVQDLRSQLLEEELRNRDRNAALLDLQRDVEAYRPYLALSPDQARERVKSAPPAEKRRLEALAGLGWGPIHMYFQLTPQQQAALRAGQTLKFGQEPEAGEEPLPAEIARGVLESRRALPRPQRQPGSTRAEEIERQTSADPGEGAPDARPQARRIMNDPDARAMLTLRLSQSELGRFSLDGMAGARIPEGGGMLVGNDGPFAEGSSPTVAKPDNAAANVRWASDLALKARVTVEPRSSCHGEAEAPAGTGRSRPLPERAGGQDLTAAPAPRPDPATGDTLIPADASRQPAEPGGGPEARGFRLEGATPAPARRALAAGTRVTSADVLEALHRATGMPIVADFYTRLYPVGSVTETNQPLFEALNRLADAMRMRWYKEGSWLQLRSASYYDDRRKEVPNRLLERWKAARQARGSLGLEELIEIASLTDDQLDAESMAEGARACWDLAEWGLARGRDQRPHLRFLAQLTPAQRQEAASAAGLAFARMTLAQQQQFLPLALGPQIDRLGSLQEIGGARVQVDVARAGDYEWHPPAEPGRRAGGPDMSPSARGQTPEAALAAARRIDPRAAPAQIAPAEPSVTFRYSWGSADSRPLMHVVRVGAGGTQVTVRMAGPGQGG